MSFHILWSLLDFDDTSGIMIAILFLLRRYHVIFILFSEFLRTPLCLNLCETNYQQVNKLCLERQEWLWLSSLLSSNHCHLECEFSFHLKISWLFPWLFAIFHTELATLPAPLQHHFHSFLLTFWCNMKGNWWFFCILLSFHLLYFSKEKYNQQKKEPNTLDNLQL